MARDDRKKNLKGRFEEKDKRDRKQWLFRGTKENNWTGKKGMSGSYPRLAPL